MMFDLHSSFDPSEEQRVVIDGLVDGINKQCPAQVLLGVTGSGKTFSIANVIEAVQKPTLVIAHNKTLAAQLYQEFRSFFPNNAVEYFVSYYDYFQPEAYIARTDTYIEKDAVINDRIERMRLSTTRSLVERQDVIVVASVSCIYGLGMPEVYRNICVAFTLGQEINREGVIRQLVSMQYKNMQNGPLERSSFRIRGEQIEIFPAYEEAKAVRIECYDTTVERIVIFDPSSTKKIETLSSITIYAGSHYVTPEHLRERAIHAIKEELQARCDYFHTLQKDAEAARLTEKVNYDIDMIREVGCCKGIENYSRHFSERLPGEPPPCLLDFFPSDFLLVIDESHQTLSQFRAMYHGDAARKRSLIEYGFRLPSAYDNRPLAFEEFYVKMANTIYVSATPGAWEIAESQGRVFEQIIRPTGLLDPPIEIRSATTQVENCLKEIRAESGRVLVTTITKKLAEHIAAHLHEAGIRACYVHSDIELLDRVSILQELRSGVYDVVVGINLLREGIDIPEVTLVIILDADKEGFLRSTTSLMQICGRAARNARGRVIMYADTMTESITTTVRITEQRRARQIAHNTLHGITPTTIVKQILPMHAVPISSKKEMNLAQIQKDMSFKEAISTWGESMRQAAAELRFQDAAEARDVLVRLRQLAAEAAAL